MVPGSYQIINCLVLIQVCLLQNCLWKLPNHRLSMSFLKYVFYKMVSGSYQIIYCPNSSMSFTKLSLEATKSYIVHVLPQVCLLQNGLLKLPNHILSCPSSSMSFTKLSLEATKSYIVHVLPQVCILQNGLLKLPNHILSMSLLKYVFYKIVSGSYQIIYCPNSSMSFTKLSLEATKIYIVHVLPQVCLLQNGHWKLPNHILSCPSSSRSFTKWSLEATKSYIVLSFLKGVFYKMVSGSYQIIYCPCPYSSMSFTKWSLEATK